MRGTEGTSDSDSDLLSGPRDAACGLTEAVSFLSHRAVGSLSHFNLSGLSLGPRLALALPEAPILPRPGPHRATARLCTRPARRRWPEAPLNLNLPPRRPCQRAAAHSDTHPGHPPRSTSASPSSLSSSPRPGPLWHRHPDGDPEHGALARRVVPELLRAPHLHWHSAPGPP